MTASSAAEYPRRRPARPVQQSAAELGCRPWRRRVSKARPGGTNRQRQEPATKDADPATRDVDPSSRQPAGPPPSRRRVRVRGGEGKEQEVEGEGGRAGAGRRRRRVQEAATAAREATRRWGEVGGAGEPPESPGQRERST